MVTVPPDQLGQVRTALRDRYRVDSVLGSGGMATVYLAHDRETDSSVALKVLRDAVSTVVGAKRFAREIAIASQLDHPNIVRVLGSGETGGIVYCVMPYVQGETLREIIERQKQLPLADAIQIGRQIADALAYAHGKGFIHRDIKPSNILVRDGQALVADFGIARAIQTSANPDSMTTSGIALGTPAYMAPEQASADRVLDGRADIYALGCVIYEMLAGEPPFTGSTPWNVAVKHVGQTPMPIRHLRSAVPVDVERVLMRALEKAPADRYATATAFRDALVDASASTNDAGGTGWGIGASRRSRLAWAAATVVALAIVAGVALTSRRAGQQVVTFTVPPPLGVQFNEDLRDVSAVSPDGKDIVFAGTDSLGQRSLWLRPLAEPTARRIRGTEGGSKAFWSPDGKRIGFVQGSSLAVVDREGGTPLALAAPTVIPRGASWADGGTIFYAPTSQGGIVAASLSGAPPRQVTTLDTLRGEIGHVWPQALPGGRRFIYFVASNVDSVRGVYIGSLDSPLRRRVVPSSASAVYADGYLLFVHDGALVAEPLDVATGALTGNRRLIADSVATSFVYYGAFSASRNGVLVYAAGPARDASRLEWMDTTGRATGYASIAGYIRNPVLSPDGRYLAFETYRESRGVIRDVDLRTGVTGALTSEADQASAPVWSPDGRALAYLTERPGGWNLYRKRIDDSGPPELLWTSTHYVVLNDWTARGQTFILSERNDAGDFDLIGRTLAAPSRGVLLAGGPGHQAGGRVSPSGDRLAYVSLESGEAQVYVQRFPGGGSRCQVSAAGGYQPVWGVKPGELYYLSSQGMLMKVTLNVDGTAACPAAAPRALFPTGIASPGGARSHYDVARNTGRLLVNTPAQRDAGAWLSVIVNWLAAARPSR